MEVESNQSMNTSLAELWYSNDSTCKLIYEAEMSIPLLQGLRWLTVQEQHERKAMAESETKLWIVLIPDEDGNVTVPFHHTDWLMWNYDQDKDKAKDSENVQAMEKQRWIYVFIRQEMGLEDISDIFCLPVRDLRTWIINSSENYKTWLRQKPRHGTVSWDQVPVSILRNLAI